MRRKLLVAAALLFSFSLYSYAQNKQESFQLALPENKIDNSLYKKIQVLDIREDTTSLGVMQKGAFNKQVKVVPEIPLSLQFSKLLSALNTDSAADGELLLLLREFRFAEVTKAMSEFGYCHFRAVLFAKTTAGYSKLQTIDTVATIRAMDVTKKTMREGSRLISAVIGQNLTKQPVGDIVLAEQQLLSIDSFEKQKLPLYTTSSFTDGLYYSYASFAQQQPDETGVKAWFDKKHRFQGLSYKNKNDQDVEIKNQFFYAFVLDGKPWISGEFTCYPLEKIGQDFFFTGKARDVKNGDVAAATFFFGIIGGLMASSATSLFEMKLDHLSGGFMRIREVEK